MISGKIKMWKEVEGWGFIEGDDGEDYFINISNVRMGQNIQLNSRVNFDVFQGQRGPEAENITLS
jgi:CspA family cold shock protein